MAVETDGRFGVQLNITAVKGRTFRRNYHAQYYSGDTLVDFDWSNYSGSTINVRRKPNSPISELTFSTDDGSIVLNPDGRFTLELSYEILDGIRSGTYYYDMYLLGSIYPRRDFLFGEFIIAQKITT